MGAKSRYSPEVRERAVRMVFEHEPDHGSQWSTIQSIASKIRDREFLFPPPTVARLEDATAAEPGKGLPGNPGVVGPEVQDRASAPALGRSPWRLRRWGERPIDEITKQDVRDLIQALADGKLAKKGKPTKVAPRNLRAVLSKMFDWAADQGSSRVTRQRKRIPVSAAAIRRVLQAILNHKDRSVTAVYDRYSLDREKREALAAWGRRVEEIVGGRAPGAVVPFPIGPAGDMTREQRSNP